MIETSGVIEKEQGNGFYLVTLATGHVVNFAIASHRQPLLNRHGQARTSRTQ